MTIAELRGWLASPSRSRVGRERMKAMKSEFAEWFKAQHGPRGNRLLAGHSDQRLRDEVQLGKVAAAELEARTLAQEG